MPPKTAADFPLPYGPNTPGLPSGLQQMANAYQQKYVDLANKVPFGVGLFGRENEYQNAVSAAWAKRLQGLIESQKGIDAITGDRNYLQTRQAQMDAVRGSKKDDNGNSVGLPTGTPDLYPRSMSGGQAAEIPYMNTAQTDNLFKSAVAPSDITAQIQLMPGMARSAMGVYQAPGSKNTLQAGATYNDIDLPPVIADPTVLQNNLAEVFKTGLTNGREKYEFDQQAPNRAAQVEELKQKALLAIQQGKTEEAKRLLLAAQTADHKAGANLKNRTNPNLRGGSQPNPTTASEKARLYNAGFYGKPGSMEAMTAYAADLRSESGDQDTDVDFKFDTNGNKIGYTSHKVSRKAGGANPQFQSTPGQKPTAAKGAHGTYLF